MEDRVDRNAVIKVANLTAIRGGRRILDDVTFDVRPGEILGVIGPNGAGKTTLFECIAGLQPVTSGTIDRGEGLFYMPDGVKPWPDQTVEWTLDVFAEMYGTVAPHLFNQRVANLSKGETKRLDIALALLTPHPVLFLDEPFDGLDLRQVRATMELLRGVKRTLVLSIHQLQDAARICDRLLLLNEGRVIAIGTPAELGDIEEVFLALTSECGGHAAAPSEAATPPAPARHGRAEKSGGMAAALRGVFRKDLGELFASRAFWLTLIAIGPLVGQAFIQAVSTYAEVSTGALPQGLSPLDGIVVPSLGAYELAIMLLFPFVAIRTISAERTTGALKLILQWPVSRAAHVLSKLCALLVAWLLSLIAFGIAMALWRGYGGHLDGGEVTNVLLGYTLRFVFTAAIAMCAAALVPGAANAAVVVLAFTIGTWALDFLATGRGGMWQTLASYTPAAALRSFERGLLRVDVVAVMLIITIVALYITARFLNLGSVVRAAIAVSLGAVAIVLASQVNVSADLSEDRRNSFAAADERALRSIDKPLTITVWLSAEDPRMNDFERNVLVKLRRTMHVDVRYPLEGRTGLFGDQYGQIEYAIGGRKAVNRSTTEEIVLETIYELARVPAPPHSESAYTGYPLSKQPVGAAVIFYVVWPITALLGLLRSRRTG